MIVFARPVGQVPTDNQRGLLSWNNPMSRSNGTLRVAMRSDTELNAFDLDFDRGELRHAAVFPAPWTRWKAAPDAVAPDLSSAVFSGQHAIRAVDQRGGLLWEREHDCWGCGDLESGSVIVTADGRHVWATAPSPHGRGWKYEGDDWLILDAATGDQVARTTLDCAAAGSFHLLHPDGIHVGLSVGEGQDGSPSYWGRLEGDTLRVKAIGGSERDRALADVSPDGRTYLTVEHGRYDVAVHDFRNNATAMLRRDASAFSPGRVYFDYEAGYITSDRVIISGVHESDHAREPQHWILDAHTAAPVGKVVYPDMAAASKVVRPLGDGTWLTADRDHVWRWAAATERG